MKKILLTLITMIIMSSCGFNDEKNEWKINNDNIVSIDQFASIQSWDVIAIMETSLWTIKFKFFPKATPKTFANFRWLAEKWFYNWLIFHRVINEFMIQWWDPTGTWMWWESIYWKDFEDEPNPYLKNVRWALSMANRWPNTNSSQFFIVQAPSVPHLDWYQNWIKTCGQIWVSCHTVFWQVFEGIDIIDKIAKVKTWPMDRPLEDVKIISVKIEDIK